MQAARRSGLAFEKVSSVIHLNLDVFGGAFDCPLFVATNVAVTHESICMKFLIWSMDG